MSHVSGSKWWTKWRTLVGAGAARCCWPCCRRPCTPRPGGHRRHLAHRRRCVEGRGDRRQGADGSSVYNGKLAWLKEATRDGKPLRDANNADAAQRERPILGLPILSGFKPAAGGWSGGTVYSPRVGKSFPAELSIAPMAGCN